MNDKVLGDIEEYFDTIKEKYFYRRDNLKRYALSQMFLVLYGFFAFIFLLASVKSEFSEQNTFLNLILSFLNEYVFYKEIQQTNITKWGIIISFLLLLFLILFFNNRILTKKMNRKGVKLHLWKFCLSFYVRNELKLYLINGDESHAKNCRKYIKWIEFPYSQFVPKQGSERNPFSLNDIRKQLQYKFEHINFDDESNYIIDSLDNLKSKVIDRIEQNTDIEVLKNIFDYQIIFEFIKIKPEHKDSDGNTLKSNYKNYLDGFIEELNSLSKIDKVSSVDKEQKGNLIGKFFIKMGSFFKSSNVHVFYISWLFAFFILCFLILKIVTLYFDVKIDSTIIVAFLTTPFLATYGLLNSPLRPK